MHFTQVYKMKAFLSTLVVALIVCAFVCTYFLFITSATAASSKQQEQRQAFGKAYLWRRIKRDLSSNHTSANTTQVQNFTTTGIPTVTTTYRRPILSWPTRRRNTASPVPLDHLGFPIIPNSRRGTRRPRPTWTKQNASRPNAKNSGKGRGGIFSHDMMDELRERENGTRTSTLRSKKFTSTDSIEISSTIPHTEGVETKSRSGNKRDISSVIAEHSIWVSVIATLFLSPFICLTVHCVRQRRRGKLMIAPAGNKGQRPAAVIFKA